MRLQMAVDQGRRDLAEAQEERDLVRGQLERAQAELTRVVQGKYFFTLQSELEPVSNKETVGFEVPEGIRLHVNYRPDQDPETHEVWTDPEDPLSALSEGVWEGITAKILSGGDWVLIQKNGVARFDARVTLKTHDNVLIDAVFTGVVDLAEAVPALRGRGRDLGADVYAAYLRGRPQVTDLPVALSVRFEAAGQPYLRPGEDGSWIEKSRYARQRRNFPRYERLVRGLFIARGTVTLDDKPRWPPIAISLKIFEQVRS
jgi:hypothetical protein